MGVVTSVARPSRRDDTHDDHAPGRGERHARSRPGLVRGGITGRPVTIVVAATEKDGQRLYARSLDRLDAVPLQGTERGWSPFFSWDGAWLGFFADGRLKRVPATGGAAVDIVAIPGFPSGASWGPDDRIVFLLRRRHAAANGRRLGRKAEPARGNARVGPTPRGSPGRQNCAVRIGRLGPCARSRDRAEREADSGHRPALRRRTRHSDSRNDIAGGAPGRVARRDDRARRSSHGECRRRATWQRWGTTLRRLTQRNARVRARCRPLRPRAR